VSERVTVDWIACQGRGLCAELLPERITMDPWGYPVLDGEPLPASLLGYARAAAKACPVRALRLAQVADRR